MDSSMVATIGTSVTDAADGVKDLLTTFLPIIAGVAVVGIGVRLAPKFIKRIAGGL